MREVPISTNWLSPAESARLVTLRFPKRRTEVRLTRWTAKHAIAAALELGTEPATLARIELRPAATGAPVPYIGDEPAPISTSLTDRADWAVCVVAPPDVAVGCDLELVEARTDAFIQDWLTERERTAVLRAGADRHLLANLIWSAKESALKVLQTGLRRDTRSVEVEILDPDGHTHWSRLLVRAEEGLTFPGWWRRYNDFLLTVTAGTDHDPPVSLETPSRLTTAAPSHSWLTTEVW
jgi:4'-phosphopantetheinyl transferase